MPVQAIGWGATKRHLPFEVVALIEALQFQGGSTDRLHNMEDSAWKSLLRFSDFANLTLSLAQARHVGIPDWVEQRLQQNLAETALRFERVCAVYSEAANALCTAGVPYIVLKGFSQAPDYVRHPGFRAQSDLDFYCPAELIPAAQAALKTLGYGPAREAAYYRFADHGPTLARPTTWEWKGNFFDPEKPLTIELHFCLWNTGVTGIPIPGVDLFWNRRVVRTIDGLSFMALNAVDHLGYMALHILREVINGGWMGHHLYELAGFLHRHVDDRIFWEQRENDHDPQLRRLETVVFCLAERWYSCTIAEPIRREMGCLPLPLRAWCAQFNAAPLEAMFRPNKDGRLLQFLIADTWSARRISAFRVLAPARIARPGDAAVRKVNPFTMRAGSGNRYLDYACYLCDRTAKKLVTIGQFLIHAVIVCVIPESLLSSDLRQQDARDGLTRGNGRNHPGTEGVGGLSTRQ